MKIYFHFSQSIFANSYLIGNEKIGEAIIIDPVKITNKLIEQIEKNKFMLKSVLITQNHQRSHENGLKTILKIYPAEVYAEDKIVDGIQTNRLRGDGIIHNAGLAIKYYSIPGHTTIFQIENILFTGASLSAGSIEKTSGRYALKNLKTHLQTILAQQSDDVIIMPAFGPPCSVFSERKINAELFEPADKKKEFLF